MPYTIAQLAKLAGVSVRTLHHYDRVGLLRPSRSATNGYRTYGDAELLLLQQILFFRELEFPLGEIKRIVTAPGFDMAAALTDQRRLLDLKRKRLAGLMRTIDTTLKKITQDKSMEDKDLYGTFSKEEMDAYTQEAKERWGHTDAWKQSQERTKHWTKEDYKRLAEDGAKFMKVVASHVKEDPASPAVQELMGQHYNALRTFYEPNLTMYRGLADMYVADARFTAYHEKFAPGLAQFMHEAMYAYCEAEEKK